MRAIISIFMKELRIQSRYKMVWINLSLTPFFMIAPYVFTAKGVSINTETMVLIGSIMWYWLNQFFFSIGACFDEERETGSFVSIALSPMSFMQYLIGKGIFEIFQCLCITIITMFIFIIIGISNGNTLKMILIYVMNGIYMFTFSIFFSALTLYFKRLSSVNFLVQQGIGMLSGITVNVSKYPRFIQVFSNIIPLTFSIKIGRAIFEGQSFMSIISEFSLLNIVSLVYLFLGMFLLKKVEHSIRVKGEWETW